MFTILEKNEITLIRDKSSFIGILVHATSVESAKQYLLDIKKEYPKAKHYCYALGYSFLISIRYCLADSTLVACTKIPINEDLSLISVISFFSNIVNIRNNYTIFLRKYR